MAKVKGQCSDNGLNISLSFLDQQKAASACLEKLPKINFKLLIEPCEPFLVSFTLASFEIITSGVGARAVGIPKRQRLGH